MSGGSSHESLVPSIQSTNAASAVGASEDLSSLFLTYKVNGILGQGTYGKVLKCTHMTTDMTVAIKMMKNESFLKDQVASEVHALCKLRQHGSSDHNIVNFYESFSDSRHHFLVFEQLDQSLKDFLDERKWQGVPLREIRPILLQMGRALDFLKVQRFMHSDIKLENVMLVNHQKEPFRVKLIDFGLADKVSRVEMGQTIQTLPYRSPEVFLVLPLTEATDMWSLGCLAAALLLGNLLYHGKSDYDIMQQIIQMQGYPPNPLLSAAIMTGRYFKHKCSSSALTWKIKTPKQYSKNTGNQTKDLRTHAMRSMKDLLCIHNSCHSISADSQAEQKDLLVFVDLLKQMLQFDATQRITPEQLLRHNFITMHHIQSLNLSSYPRSCFEKMRAFQRLPGCVNVESLQQSSS